MARRGAKTTNKSFARETPVYKRFRRSMSPWAEERHITTALYSQPCDLWTVIAHAGRRLARTSDFVLDGFFVEGDRGDVGVDGRNDA